MHASVFNDVRELIYNCNIQNYFIYLKDATLFSYYEYLGSDYNMDIEKMGACSIIQKWWEITDNVRYPWKLDQRVNEMKIWKRFSIKNEYLFYFMKSKSFLKVRFNYLNVHIFAYICYFCMLIGTKM